jgi:hypothetical protein
MPLDFRFDAYNGADLTMQGAPYLLGNEVAKLTNATVGGGQVAFHLPGLHARASALLPDENRELVTSLDTLVFIPGRLLFYVVWRATLALKTADASEVEELRVEYPALRQLVTSEEVRRYAGSASV